MANTAKVLIILALVALVFVGYFVFGYRLKQNEIETADEQLADLQRKLKEVKAVADSLQPTEREIELLDQNLKQSLAQLPEDKQIEVIMRHLDELASTSGLEILKLVPTAEVPRDFYAEIPIELEVQGGYHNIAIFFDKISKLKRVINIVNLKLSAPTEIGGEVRVTASCVATTFRFRRAGEMAPPPALKKEEKPKPEPAPPPEKDAKKGKGKAAAEDMGI
jgi:type IV pilus assembly protein PilO